jgi:hypothetical protein
MVSTLTHIVLRLKTLDPELLDASQPLFFDLGPTATAHGPGFEEDSRILLHA